MRTNHANFNNAMPFTSKGKATSSTHVDKGKGVECSGKTNVACANAAPYTKRPTSGTTSLSSDKPMKCFKL